MGDLATAIALILYLLLLGAIVFSVVVFLVVHFGGDDGD